MSAQVLREAAALMRARAEAATSGVCPQWTYSAVRHIARNCEIECYHEADDPLLTQFPHIDGEPETWGRYDDHEHIASWSPAVAIAVADWLDAQATLIEASGDFFEEDGCDSAALAVARAYLGQQP